MLTLLTVYSHVLNDSVANEYMAEKENRVVGDNFLPLVRL